MSYNVYILEDERSLNELLSYFLRNEGWQVKSFYNGFDALSAIDEKPHLWVLDIMLPDIDGFQILAQIKNKYPKTPVIFISARDADLDRVLGLEKGSDDYLAKPFSPRELVIRVNNLLKRFYGENKDTINYLDYTAYLKKRSVLKQDGSEVGLTSKEFDLLKYFLENLRIGLSRQQILSNVWDDNYYGSERVVDDLVRRLRGKMPELNVETLYGFGYRLLEK